LARELVIVGGSYAGAQVAASARQSGFQEPIRILSEERHPPYQRPPLSKAFLTEAGDAAIPLRAEAFYREQGIQLELGVKATRLDRAAKILETQGGARIPYQTLVLATGARPRAPAVEGRGLEGVCLLRTIEDARTLKARLAGASSVAVIGGGFIGLEVAASCAKLGKKVTVVESLPRLMSRALPEVLGSWFASKHQSHGVELRLGAGLAAFRGTNGKVSAVALSDGTQIDAQLVVVGIGVLPNEELAAEAGLQCANGVLVDRFGRSSDPAVYAIGDCSRHLSRYAPSPLRLESVQNAMDQARAAGATLAGKETPYDAVPWFWSDQYDVKLQMAGLSAGHDAHAVRGSLDEGKFSIYYLRQGTLVGVDSVNRPADHMLARKLVAARCTLSVAQAADAGFDLKALAG
jgi:3-phenylpropionate/trans-cinnamate dioxygenase ferredoxin reductase subunit